MRQPEPWRSLQAEIRKIREDIRQLKKASSFTDTGMTPDGGGGMVFDPGLIPATALSSPNVPGVAGVTATNFGLSTTLAEVVGVDLPVPDGCTQLLISATGVAYVQNPGAADALWVSVKIASTASPVIGQPLAAAGQGSVTGVLGTALTGLAPLSVLRLGLWAGTSTGTISAATANTAALTAALTWKP